jgi:pilus assembly protein Flp/PilA
MLEKMHETTKRWGSTLGVKPLDRGAAAVEYGLLVALVAVVIAAIVTAVGVDLQGVFQTAAGMFP